MVLGYDISLKRFSKTASNKHWKIVSHMPALHVIILLIKYALRCNKISHMISYVFDIKIKMSKDGSTFICVSYDIIRMRYSTQ